MLRRKHLPADGKALPPVPAGGRVIVLRAREHEQWLARDSASLRAVLYGTEGFEIGGRSYRLRAGQMMLLPAGPPVRAWQASRADLHSVSIELPASSALLDVDAPALLLPLASHSIGEWLGKIAQCMDDLGSTAEVGAAAALRDVQGQTADLLVECRRSLAKISSVKTSTRSEMLTRVEIARAYLRANLDRTVPLWELAEVALISQFHLARAFRELLGSAPSAYHRRLRLDAALARLRSGEGPAQTARALGFGSHAAFSRSFARQFGFTPRAASDDVPGASAP